MQSSTSPPHAEDTDRHIKIFLSALHRLDPFLREVGDKKGEKPIWLEKWSFLNLLNMKETLNYHGPLRNYYGGLPLGEGIIREVKPHVTKMTTGWEKATAIKFMTHKCMARLM